MITTELKNEVDSLSDRDQRELLTYLAHIREIRDPAYLNRITKMIDDRNPDRWVSLKDLKKDIRAGND